jgi:hypothetical protein
MIPDRTCFTLLLYAAVRIGKQDLLDKVRDAQRCSSAVRMNGSKLVFLE